VIDSSQPFQFNTSDYFKLVAIVINLTGQKFHNTNIFKDVHNIVTAATLERNIPVSIKTVFLIYLFIYLSSGTKSKLKWHNIGTLTLLVNQDRFNVAGSAAVNRTIMLNLQSLYEE